MLDAEYENLMSQEPPTKAVHRRGSHMACAGLAAWSLLSSQLLCGAAWCAEAAPPAPAPSPAPVVAPAPAPLAGLSFLIVALDDADLARAAAKIGAPAASPAAPASAIPIPPAAAISPLTPNPAQTGPLRGDKASATPVAPIQPAADQRFPQHKWTLQSLALQTARLAKAKVEEPPLTLTPEPRQDGLPVAPPAAAPDNSLAAPAPNATAPDNSGFGALVPARVNRALAISSPLRRALAKAGSPDVLDTGFDGAAILRALNNHRLSPRTLDALVDSVAQILQAGKVGADDPNLKAAAQTAARIGQTLGYRGVIAVAIQPKGAAPAGGFAKPTVSATVALLVVDTLREFAEPVVFDETGVDDNALNEAAAATGRALIEKIAQQWPPMGNEDKRRLSMVYLGKAREALARNEEDNAVDLLNQSVSLDGNQLEAYLLLGDLVAARDATAAAGEYRRAAEMSPRDGKVWSKVAIAYTKGATPDWPRALETAKKALALGYESSELRLAMAVAQWGRAEIFTRHERLDLAREAEAEARTHLDRALFIIPQDDPSVSVGIASQLVAQGRYRDSVKLLAGMAKLYPDDVNVQSLLAQAYTGLGNQEEEAFVAWAKVWQLSHQAQITVDVPHYATLMEGFDKRLSNLGKAAAQLTGSVLAGGMLREQALLQMTRLTEDMTLTQNTIKMVAPPTPTQRVAYTSRTFAADLMMQALGFHNQFLETGDDTFYNRALDLHRQAIITLNAVRTR